jgi:hypothetical protein
MLFLGVALYAGGGLAYNHKQRGMPLEPASLPHVEFWGEVRALTMDGVVFFRARIEEARTQHAEKQQYEGLEEVDEAQAPAARPPPRTKPTQVEQLEDQHQEAEGDEWETVGRDLREVVKEGVHSSQAPIRVEIQRSDVGPAAPWEGVE